MITDPAAAAAKKVVGPFTLKRMADFLRQLCSDDRELVVRSFFEERNAAQVRSKVQHPLYRPPDFAGQTEHCLAVLLALLYAIEFYMRGEDPLPPSSDEDERIQQGAFWLNYPQDISGTSRCAEGLVMAIVAARTGNKVLVSGLRNTGRLYMEVGAGAKVIQKHLLPMALEVYRAELTKEAEKQSKAEEVRQKQQEKEQGAKKEELQRDPIPSCGPGLCGAQILREEKA